MPKLHGEPPTQSWVASANGPHGFGLNHLPYGAFRADGATHLCVRIGDSLLDLFACQEDGLFDELAPPLQQACKQATLNSVLASGQAEWKALRDRLSALLEANAPADLQRQAGRSLQPIAPAAFVLPLDIPGYTDFYASLHHARRVGELFRPDAPLLPNYKHVPIAYNGRASSIVVSGSPVRRPRGQQRAENPGGAPMFGPTAALDYELELAFVIGRGNALGQPIPIAAARDAIFGVTLLNDWSARDIQSWEYQPLGPFLGKSFATTISPWITPMAALEPFRVPATSREPSDPQPLAYLWSDDDQRAGALDIAVEVRLSTVASRAAGLPPMRVSQASASGLYWTAAQMVSHHTSNGCNLRAGDLLASGTISNADRASAGCLLELTRNGAEPLVLANGERRAWLQDGDEVTLMARCERGGVAPVVLGECWGRINPSVP